MRRIITLAIAVTVTVAGANTAQAATKGDRRAMSAANDRCEYISDDVAWERCVIRQYREMTGQRLTFRQYKVNDNGRIVFVPKGN